MLPLFLEALGVGLPWAGVAALSAVASVFAQAWLTDRREQRNIAQSSEELRGGLYRLSEVVDTHRQRIEQMESVLASEPGETP